MTHSIQVIHRPLKPFGRLPSSLRDVTMAMPKEERTRRIEAWLNYNQFNKREA